MIDATTEIEVGVDCRGHTVVRRMYCEAPMLVRVVDEPGACADVGNGQRRCRAIGRRPLPVPPRCRCRCSTSSVRSVAAAMAQPGPHGERSELTVESVIAERASPRLATRADGQRGGQ